MLGKITKLTKYKSGKGYFIGIDGKEYMFYGEPNVEVDDFVNFERGKDAPDGKPTIKTLS